MVKYSYYPAKDTMLLANIGSFITTFLQSFRERPISHTHTCNSTPCPIAVGPTLTHRQTAAERRHWISSAANCCKRQRLRRGATYWIFISPRPRRQTTVRLFPSLTLAPVISLAFTSRSWGSSPSGEQQCRCSAVSAGNNRLADGVIGGGNDKVYWSGLWSNMVQVKWALHCIGLVYFLLCYQTTSLFNDENRRQEESEAVLVIMNNKIFATEMERWKTDL